MSKTTHHECPVDADREILQDEIVACNAAKEVRTWYAVWEDSWRKAHERHWVMPSGSALWRQATREARLGIIDPNQLEMVRWIAAYTGADAPEGWLTPSEEADAVPL